MKRKMWENIGGKPNLRETTQRQRTNRFSSWFFPLVFPKLYERYTREETEKWWSLGAGLIIFLSLRVSFSKLGQATCVHLFPPLFFFSFRWRLISFQKEQRKANRWIKRKRDGGKKSHVKERLVQEGWRRTKNSFPRLPVISGGNEILLLPSTFPALTISLPAADIILS